MSQFSNEIVFFELDVLNIFFRSREPAFHCNSSCSTLSNAYCGISIAIRAMDDSDI